MLRCLSVAHWGITWGLSFIGSARESSQLNPSKKNMVESPEFGIKWCSSQQELLFWEAALRLPARSPREIDIHPQRCSNSTETQGSHHSGSLYPWATREKRLWIQLARTLWKMLLHDRTESFWHCHIQQKVLSHTDKTPKGPYIHTPTEPKRPKSRSFYNYGWIWFILPVQGMQNFKVGLWLNRKAIASSTWLWQWQPHK